MGISVQTMIRNEIDLLPRYYASIKEWAKEWVILDAASTDGSLEYLEKVKSIAPDFIKLISSDGYDLKNCKNFNFLLQDSLNYCTQDWVWLGYIDEFVPALKYTLPRLLDKKYNYLFTRVNLWDLKNGYYDNREHFIRLYPREGSSWVGESIHSEKLKNNYKTIKIDSCEIYHMGPARSISKICDKEVGFEACGKTVLTSKFTEADRWKYPKNRLDLIEISHLFRTSLPKPMITPYKILRYWNDNNYFLLSTPRMVEFFLTDHCNHSCKYCLFNSSSKPCRNINSDYVYSVMKQLIGRTHSIEYCGGGEPTLHPQFDEFAMTGNVMGYEQGLLTNGSTLFSKYKILPLYFRFVRVSLDAHDAALHYGMHGASDFERIVSGLRSLVAERDRISSTTEVGIKCLLDKNNLFHIEDMVELAKDVDVGNIQFKSARMCSTELGDAEVKVANKIIAELSMKYPDFVYGSASKSVNETPSCISNVLASFIDASGDVYICCYFQGREEAHKFGNLGEKSFMDIWASKEHFAKISGIDIELCNLVNCRFHKYNSILYDNRADSSRFV